MLTQEKLREVIDPTVCQRCGGDATESEHDFWNCQTDEEKQEEREEQQEAENWEEEE